MMMESFLDGIYLERKFHKLSKPIFILLKKDDLYYNNTCAFPTLHHGSVAQRIERRFPKPCVTGSIPVGAVLTKPITARVSAFSLPCCFCFKKQSVTDRSPLAWQSDTSDFPVYAP